jgi:hypothetical protein
MKKVLQRRPSAAMIVAMIALIAALAGTAIAGGGFITKKKFNNRINGINATIGTTLRGPLTYSSVTVNVPPTGAGGQDVAAPCPPGTQPTGGGIKVSNDTAEIVNDSHVTSTGWAGTVFNVSATVTHTATTTAICAVVASTAGSRPAS